MPAHDPAGYMRAYRAARRRPIEPRPCEHCHRSFTPQRSYARFCSDVCRSAARRNRVDVTWKRILLLKNGKGCAESGCGAEHARWAEYRYHVGTGQTEVSYWCGEHAGCPLPRRPVHGAAQRNAEQLRRR
jgi:hypothetical protein